jgi:hypothetical protein
MTAEELHAILLESMRLDPPPLAPSEPIHEVPDANKEPRNGD